MIAGSAAREGRPRPGWRCSCSRRRSCSRSHDTRRRARRRSKVVNRQLTNKGTCCPGGFRDGGTLPDTISKRLRSGAPNDRRLTVDLPPPPRSGRWLPRLKFLIVAAVDSGQLSMPEACKLYGLTSEEFIAWRYSVCRHGSDALKVTLVQKYRPTAMRRQMRRRRAPARVVP
jgi:Protein of unknown function (DUF1153)